MAGMIQIMTYLLCVYLVFKGIEILQIALMSPRENRTLGIVIGLFSLVACCTAAAFFFAFITQQAESISRAMTR